MRFRGTCDEDGPRVDLVDEDGEIVQEDVDPRDVKCGSHGMTIM